MPTPRREKVGEERGRSMFLDELQKRFAEMQTRTGISAVFGEPISIDGRTVIPVASMRYAFGMGGGMGPARGEGDQVPGGGGGGGMARVEPIALVEVVDGKIKVQPIINVTRLAGLVAFLAAWAIFWGTRTARVMAARR
ncbi:MAG: spore germination protein GerW family protein [Armatimonadota bacterium]|nr:spore germination protein GerW family protein [Armatimonadota bacterium]MDR7450535.1 spore germination protein GerW family protein [Armatimonadota bacterium]MDR7466332.1 spore germination protein GerW family protein [Armatimonadota bacterium]MDR7493053.1 spore germination protein GerW family protein [Armatimonadota bacterium]MDR7498190.1 spore germination protein GerW family protein [Armatimonadota bacterium]